MLVPMGMTTRAVCLALFLTACHLTGAEPPSTPPMRIAVAEITPEKWEGKSPQIQMRDLMVAWLDGYAGITVAPEALPALPWPTNSTPAEELASVRAACSAGRERSLDAVIFGRHVHGDWEVLRCSRSSGSKGGPPCTRVSNEVEAVGVRSFLDTIVVRTSDCAYSRLFVRGIGDAGSLEVAYQIAMDELRTEMRAQTPRVLRSPPTQLPDGTRVADGI